MESVQTEATDLPTITAAADAQSDVLGAVAPQACASCGSKPAPAGPAPAGQAGIPGPRPAGPSFVFAAGVIEPLFCSRAVEEEFTRLRGNINAAGLSDQQALRKVLKDKEHFYLAQSMGWTFSVGNVVTYLLAPSVPGEVGQFLDTLEDEPDPARIHLALGVKGPLAPPERCNGMMLPIVVVHKLWVTKKSTLVAAIQDQRREKTSAKEFAVVAEEIFDRLIDRAASEGSSHEQRAITFAAFCCPQVYNLVVEYYEKNYSLKRVYAQRAPVTSLRAMTDVRFVFEDRTRDREDTWSLLIDTQEMFMFPVSKLRQRFD